MIVKPSWLSLAPLIMTGLFLGPVLVGLLGTLLPAFGFFPALGKSDLNLEAWRQLSDYPGVAAALTHTLVSGLGASFLSLGIVFIVLMALYPSPVFRRVERWLAPILSIPHAAFAIGFGFLLMPSGQLVRLFSLIVPGLEQPPAFSSYNDPYGISLVFALLFKEVAFLLFMALAALPSINVQKTLWLGRSLGYSNRFIWSWLIFPQLYQRIRLPFFAVLAFSLSVVDIALIAGPSAPPTFAVMITRFFTNPDLELRLVGAAGALVLLGIVLFTLLLIYLTENILRKLRRYYLFRGQRTAWSSSVEKFAAYAFLVLGLVTFLFTFCMTLIWSFADRWRYPDLLPSQFTSRSWQRAFERLDDPLWLTLFTALAAALIATALCLMALENEVRLRYSKRSLNTERLLLWLYLPLIVPQIAFLFGFQVSLIYLKIDASWWSLLWSHLVFVIPYVFLTLSGAYRQFDDRYMQVAFALSGHRWQSYWRIKFMMLLRPIFYAFATGFAVSVAQYLPTLFSGGGRFATVTTEAVAMASGSDRRMTAVMAIWQQALPLVVFLLALIVPTFRYRRFRAMRHQ